MKQIAGRRTIEFHMTLAQPIFGDEGPHLRQLILFSLDNPKPTSHEW